MLDILASSKSERLYEASVRSSVSKESQQSGSSFAEVMDRSVSQQKSLTRELEQNKENRSYLKDLKQKIQVIEKKSAVKSEDVDALKDMLYLVEKVMDEEIDSSPLLEDLATQLISLLNQNIQEALNGGISDHSRYMSEKISFILESAIQDIQANTLSLFQKESLKELLFYAQAAENDRNLSTDRVLQEDEVSAMKLLNSSEETEVIDKKTAAPDPLVVFKDLRSTLKSTLKEMSIEAKFQQGQESSEQPALTLLKEQAQSFEATLQKSVDPVLSHSSSVLQARIENMMSQMSARAVYTLKDGGSEFRMKLTPPELGQMKVSFRIDDGIMQGKVVVSTPEAKALMEQNMDLLKESLRQAGVDITQLDVSLGGQGDFSQEAELPEYQDAFQAVRVHLPHSPIEMMSRGLTVSEIDYTA